MRRRVPSADHGKFKGDERQGSEQGGIRSIRFKYHARILPFWNKGERQISLWYAMRVNRDKERLLVTCVCSNIEREAAVRTETIGWIIGILIAAALVLVDLPQNKEENTAAGEYAGGTGASVCGKAFIGR